MAAEIAPTTGVTHKLEFRYRNTNSAGEVTTNPSNVSKSTRYTNGTGANQVNSKYSVMGTLAASATTTLDMSALTGDFGNAIAFTSFKEIMFELLTDTAATSILIGGAAATQFAALFGDVSDKVRVYNGGFIHASCPNAAGYAVGAAKSLKIANEDASNIATYRLTFLGCV